MQRSSRTKPSDLYTFRVRFTDCFGEHIEYFKAFPAAQKRFRRIEQANSIVCLIVFDSLYLDVLDGLEWVTYYHADLS